MESIQKKIEGFFFFLNVVLQTLPKNVAPSENEFFRQQSGTSQLEKQHEKEKKKNETKIYIRKGLWQFDMHSHGRCVKRFREPEKKNKQKTTSAVTSVIVLFAFDHTRGESGCQIDTVQNFPLWPYIVST